MNINVMNQPYGQPQTQMQLTLDENCKKQDFDLLLSKYEKLKKEFEDYKFNTNLKLNENAIIDSMAFKSILEQSESNVSIIGQIKELYLKLKGKYDETVKDNDLDIKKIEDKVYKNNDNFRKKYYEIKDENNKLKSELSEINHKIAEQEATKSDCIDFTSVYELFDKEKKRLNDELSNIIKIYSDQKEKLYKEIDNNNILQEENIILKNENEDLKNQVIKFNLTCGLTGKNSNSNNSNCLNYGKHTNGSSDIIDTNEKEIGSNQLQSISKEKESINTSSQNNQQSSMSLNLCNSSENNNLLVSTFNSNNAEEKYNKHKYQELVNSLKSKKEKIVIYDKKYNKIKEDLNSEKITNESLLRELEANEVGLNEMNKQILLLQEQISKENQKVAMLTKEKINSQRNIEKLTLEREINKNLVTLHKSQKNEIEIHIKKLSEDIGYLKGLVYSGTESLQAKDKEIINMSVALENEIKKIRESESIIKQQKKIIDGLNSEKLKIQSDFDLINLKKKDENKKKDEYIFKTNDENLNEMMQEYEILKVRFLFLLKFRKN